MKKDFKDGFISSIPIVLAYFFVSIGVGVYAYNNGITPFQATLMSFTNLTSAGEISAVKIFGESGGYFELFFAQLVINARYALMAISLSQKCFEPNFGTKKRMLTAYGITDEIFAVMINRKEKITSAFVTPLIIAPLISWSLGTYIGSVFSSLIPHKFISPFSILIYAMLISIIAPESKKSKPVALTVIIAAIFSSIIYYFAKFITSGYSIIIASILSATICAILFPTENKCQHEGSTK